MSGLVVTLSILSPILQMAQKKRKYLRVKINYKKSLLELVNQNAKQVQAYNVIAGTSISFEVQGVLYNSNTPDNKRNWIIWGTEKVEEDEVEELF
ncbi:MAG: hypothetical protein NC238_01290 [Dehalobacter sp.]|nr:hypothetical protein [Dehalobacter sp.]